MQLTEHFTAEELGVAQAEPPIVANATWLCAHILEPIRAEFGPVHVHDGFRAPAHNSEVGGKSNSFHLYLLGESAADIDALPAVSIPDLFDWIRLKSKLPFDKVILEYNSSGQPGCVHLQADSAKSPRRQAFIGSTGAGTSYRQVEVL